MNIKKISFLFFVFFIVSSNTTLDRSLIVAISKGDFLKVKSLVESGADVNTRYHKGKSALHWAVSSGNFKIVAYLLYKGAKVEVYDENGSSPLQLSAIGRNLDIVKLLVQSGANVAHIDKNGWDVLHYFVFYEFGMGIKYLLTQGVPLTNVTKRKYLDVPAGLTALDIAYKKNYEDIIKTLESPYRFTKLYQKPIIMYSFRGNLGDDNAITPFERGTLIIDITNLGGVEARNLTFQLVGVSNTTDIEFENTKSFNISSGETKEITFNIRGLSISKSERAFFELYFINEDKTNVHKFFISKVYKPLPDPVVLAMFKYPFDLISGSKTNTVFRIENKGKGNLENATLNIEFLNTNIIERFFEYSNININAGGVKDFNISFSTIENLDIRNYENVKAKIIFSSSLVSYTNFFDFKIISFPLPELYSDVGHQLNSFTNLLINSKGEISLFISNKNNDGKNLELRVFQKNEKKEFFIKDFPQYGSINLFFDNFSQDEKERKIDIEIFYKTKNIYKKNFLFVNTNYVEPITNSIEEIETNNELKESE